MKSRIAAALCLAVLIVAGCKPSTPSEPAGGKLRACAGIAPIGWFVSQIGGAHVQVDVIVGAGQSPHAYEPTARELKAAGSALLYFGSRMEFETQLARKLAAINPRLKVIDITARIPLRKMTEEELEAEEHEEAAGAHEAHEGHEAHEEHAAGAPDPHVWLNPRHGKIIAENVAAALKEADPAHAAEFDANLAAVKAKLDAVDERIAQILAPFKGRQFMVYHPAFGYFGDAYGLKQVPVEVSGKEPSARDLAEFIKRAREADVRIIFVQPQFSTRSADMVAQSIGGAVVRMDDLAADYLKNLEDMADSLARALQSPPKGE